MPGLRVGVVIRWPQVEQVLRAMLGEMRHRPIVPGGEVPDVVVRDVGCKLPAAWGGQPMVVLSGAAVGAVREMVGRVRLGKPFTLTQLATALRRAVQPAA